MRGSMRLDKLRYLGLLLILGKVFGTIENVNQIPDRIIGPINHGHSRTLLAISLPGVDGKNLVLLLSVEAQTPCH